MGLRKALLFALTYLLLPAHVNYCVSYGVYCVYVFWMVCVLCVVYFYWDAKANKINQIISNHFETETET